MLAHATPLKLSPLIKGTIHLYLFHGCFSQPLPLLLPYPAQQLSLAHARLRPKRPAQPAILQRATKRSTLELHKQFGIGAVATLVQYSRANGLENFSEAAHRHRPVRGRSRPLGVLENIRQEDIERLGERWADHLFGGCGRVRARNMIYD